MDKIRTFAVLKRRLTGAAFACVLMALGMAAVVTSQAFAQEQFFTQSGGRGLQNAKTNARLSKVESNVGDLQATVSKIKPFAFAELGTCADDGEKLRWDGKNWICEQETDPTVQPFAKKALPTCTGGAILGVSGGEFSCQNVGFVTSEVDPTVQQFAKQPLPACGVGQVLAVGSGNALVCSADNQGVAKETDPTVQDFAKTGNGLVANCSASESLTMSGGHLTCKLDSGITTEVDPMVQSFARSDVSAAVLSACASGEILKAVDSGGTVVLQCTSVAGAMVNVLALNDLRDVSVTNPASNTVLMFTGSGWEAKDERDPSVADWAKNKALAGCGAGQVLSFDGTNLTCVNDAGGSAQPLTLANLGDVNVTGKADGNLLAYNAGTSKWEDLAVPTCSTGQTLTANGTTMSCVNDAGGASDPLDLVELGDVRISAGSNLVPSDKDLLRWSSSASRWVAVHDMLSVSQTTAKWCYFNGTDVVCDRGAPLECSSGEVMKWSDSSHAFSCVAAASELGLGTMASQDADSVAITGGTINGTVIGGSNAAAGTFTTMTATSVLAGDIGASGLIKAPSLQVSTGLVQGDLTVTGNLNVSGSQSIDGVTFANGGIQLTGALAGDQISVTNVSVSQNVSVTGNVSAAKYIGDGSGLTGVVAAAGNWYTMINIPAQVQEVSNSGAIVMAGISATNISVTDALSAASARVTGDLHVGGNFYVSGSQSIDGVTFANGGIQLTGGMTGDRMDVANVSASENVSVTGNVSANKFIGDGSGLSGVVASSADWYALTRIPAQVQAVSNSGAIALSGVSSTNVSVTNNLTVGGSSVVTGGLTAATGGFGGLTVTGNSVLAAVSATKLDVSGNTGVGGDLTVDGSLIAGSAGLGNVAANNVSVTSNVSVTGNVSAAKFFGDGSALSGITTVPDWYALTNIPAQVQAVSNSGLLVLAGVSATGPISATDGYFGGNVSVVGNSSMYNLTASHNVTVNNELIVANGKRLSWGGAGNSAIVGDASAKYLQFLTSYVEAMRIVSNGYVGINAVTPTAQLEVNGTISATNLRLSGNLYVSGSQAIDGVVFANGGVSATGTISATKFIGDGSGLTGVTAAATDRIISGSTLMVVDGATGYVSLTQNSGNTAWFDPARGLVTLGVSSTGAISGTSGYFSGGLGVGTSTPNAKLEVVGRVSATEGYFSGGVGFGTAPNSSYSFNTGGSGYIFNNLTVANGGLIVGTAGQGLKWGSGSEKIIADTGATNHYMALSANSAEAMRIVSSGNVGIGTNAPNAKLDVYGRVSATNLALSGDATLGGALTAGSAGIGNLAVNNISASQNVSVTGNVSAAKFFGDGSALSGITTVPDWYALTNIPAQVQAVSNSGAIALSGVSSTNVSVTNNLTVGGSSVVTGGLTAATGGFGGLTVTGNSVLAAVSATKLDVSGRVSATNLALSGDATLGGGLTAGSAAIGNLAVNNISATQNVSVTGNVSAAKFIGDGSGLTGVSAGGLSAAGVAGSIQYQGASGEVSGSSLFLIEASARNMQVSGTVQVGGSGAESCAAGAYGKMRFVLSGGAMRMQVCRP